MTQLKNIVGVQFRKAGKIYDFETLKELRVGERVIVETDRGPTIAVIADVRMEAAAKYKNELKKIVRKANYKDFAKSEKFSDKDALATAETHVKNLKLKMRVLKVEVSMGGNKVTVFFSAPDRVDFRELLKLLATNYKARVELKQVGSRDEAKILGGVGICGREYCCSTFLREFVPVSIKMAKNQNLALNPTKVSGGCGRLLCCLTYENDVYTELKSTMPPVGVRVHFDGGREGRILSTDIFNQIVVVEDESGMTQEVDVAQVESMKAKPKKEQAKKEQPNLVPDDWGKDIDLKELLESQPKRSKNNNKNHRHKNKKK